MLVCSTTLAVCSFAEVIVASFHHLWYIPSHFDYNFYILVLICFDLLLVEAQSVIFCGELA